MIFDSAQTYSGRAYRDCIATAHKHSVPILLARRGMRWTSGDGVTLDLSFPLERVHASGEFSIPGRSVWASRSSRAIAARVASATSASDSSGANASSPAGQLHRSPAQLAPNDQRKDQTSAGVVIRDGRDRTDGGPQRDGEWRFRIRDCRSPAIRRISVGRHNTFGHPAAATIESWSNAGADIL